MFHHACFSLHLFLMHRKPHAVAMPIIKHHDNKVNIVSKAAHSKNTTGATFINLTTFSNKQDNTSFEHQLWREQTTARMCRGILK